MQPAETVSDLYSAADVNVIPLKPGIIQTALPSKLADCLIAGRPIVTCFDADAHFCAEASQYGIPNVPPDSPEGLVMGKQNLLEHPELSAMLFCTLPTCSLLSGSIGCSRT